jgi:hypothetical protein
MHSMSLHQLSSKIHTVKDLKAHINPNTVIVGNFNTHLSPTDRSSKQKKNQQRNPSTK